MRIKNIFFIALFFLSMAANNVAAKDAEMVNKTTIIPDEITEDIINHTVAQGETVYSIAAAYHTTVQEIYRLNPKAEKGIKVGQKIKVPKVKLVVSGYSTHLIEPKETLYSVSRMYKISENDVKEANPGLSESNFRAGQSIKIPQFSGSTHTIAPTEQSSVETYLVKKKETLYSISKANNISVSDLLNANPPLKDGGLKEGMTIVIPDVNQSIISDFPLNTTVFTETPYASKGELVKIGVLLPFLDKKGSVSKEKLTEYYEGFLLAVKQLKDKGLNAEIYTFDIGAEKNTKKLESLLGTTEMNSLHLIIGGVSKQQIDVLANFSNKTGIKYAMPFGSSESIGSNPTLFQITSSHSSLYPEIMEAFKNQYKNDNIIFVSEAGSNNNESKFIDQLKKELSTSGIQFKTTATTSSLTSDITAVLSSSKKNVLIPTSSSELTLQRVITAIGEVESNISLFGYPEWQIYAQHKQALHKYDAHIFSIYFVNEQMREVQNFGEEYKKWYNKPLINSFPKYAYLGYDAGLFFLTALNRYGSSFETEINSLKAPTIQSAIRFEKQSEQGGYINKGLYFVHYKANSDIEKIDINNKW